MALEVRRDGRVDDVAHGLEAENARLRKMYIEEKLKAEIASEALQKFCHLAGARCCATAPRVNSCGVLVFGISESCYRYEAKLNTENEEIADWLMRITGCHRNWGFLLCYYYLRNVQGFGWNHKRIYRIYRELELNLRIKPKRLVRETPQPLSVPPSTKCGQWTSCMTSSLTGAASGR